MKLILQALTLILASGFVFLIMETSLSSFAPEVLGLLIIVSIIYSFILRRKRRGKEVFVGANKEIFIILVAILFIVFLTGGIKSPIFFLTYFILFGIAFIFEPLMIFLFLICLILIFLPQVLQDDIFGNSLTVGSLVFVTPIAFLFGREYKRREKLQAAIKEKANAIIKDAESVLETKDKGERLKHTEDIITEARELKKESE